MTVFGDSKGVFYANATNLPGGINVGRLRAAPGGPWDLVLVAQDDPAFTRALRDQVVGTPGLPTMKFGVFSDPHHYAGLFPSMTWKDDNGRALPDPLGYRQHLTADVLTKLAIGDPVVLDFEKTPEAWQTVFFIGSPSSSVAGWRGRQGIWWKFGSNMGRPTAVSNEPHQDNPTALYKQAMVAYLAQLYDGQMNNYPAWKEAQWEAADGQDMSQSFPIFDAEDFDPQDITPGSYIFPADRFHALTS